MSNSHTVGSNSSQQGSLEATISDAGTYQATISSSSDSDSVQVTVESADDGGETEPDPIEPEGEVVGYVDADYGEHIKQIPLYDPDSIAYPCWRVQVTDDGLVGAFDIRKRPTATHPEWSINTLGGVYAINEQESDEQPPQPPDGSDEPDLLIDDFENGIRGRWTNSVDWATHSGYQYEGDWSAQRWSGGSGLWAGPEHFSEFIRPGGPIFRITGMSHSNNGIISIPFGRDENRPEFNRYAATLHFGDNEVGMNYYMNGQWNEMTHQSVTLDTDTWYEMFIQWQSNGDIQVSVYESGNELTSFSVSGVGITGDYWAIWTRPANDKFVDEVGFYESHPHTGEESDEDVGSGEPTEPNLIDSFEYSDLSTNWDGSTGHYVITDINSRHGDYSLTDAQSFVGARIESNGNHDSYPTKGEKILYRFLVNNGTGETSDTVRPRMFVGYEDTGNFYVATVNVHSGRVFISERNNHGSWTTKDVVENVNVPGGTWLLGALQWRDGELSFRLYNDETDEALCRRTTVSLENTLRETGGIAYSAEAYSSNDTVYLDYITKAEL